MSRMTARRGASAIGTVALVAGAASAGALIWGTLIERRWYALRQVSAPVLPSGSRPIRVLHLSDLHMAPWQRDKQEWIRSLAAYAPDLIVDTGDNLGHERGFDGVKHALDAFKGVPGVFVNGSNDYYGPIPKNPMRYFSGPSTLHAKPSNLDTGELTGYFANELGWLDLNNHAGALTVNGTRLELFGVDDPHRNFDRLDTVTGELDELRASEETDDGWRNGGRDGHPAATVAIGVAHAPYRRILDSFVTNGASMIFAGHTHGGQVCAPGFGALVTNCDLPRRQAKGLSTWTHALRVAYLNVSAGLGTSIYSPVRFACRPEASLVTLVPQDTHFDGANVR
jgi:predicted MPP superfamily phosphohydrolase